MLRALFLLVLWTVAFPNYSFAQADKQKADSLFSLAQKSFNSDNYTDAENYYQMASDLYKTIDYDKHLEALILKNETISYSGWAKRSILELPAVDSLVQLTDNEWLKSRSKMVLGNTRYDLGQKIQAVKEYESGISHAEKANDIPLVFGHIRNASLVCVELQRLDQALTYAKRGLSIANTLDDMTIKARANNIMFNAYRDLGDTDRSEIHIKAFLEYVKYSTDTLSIGNAHNNYAIFLREKGDIDLSIYHFQKGLEVLRKVNDTVTMSRSLQGIAYNYQLIGDYERAMEYAADSYNILDETRINRRAVTSKYAALSFRRAQKFDEAEVWFQKAYEHFSEMDDSREEGDLHTGYAGFNLQIGKLDKAEQVVDQILSKPVSTFSPNIYFDMLALKSEIAFARKNYPLFLEYAKQAYSYFNRIHGINQKRATASLARASFYNNSDNAFVFANKYFELLDSDRKGSIGFVLESGLVRRESNFYKEVAGWYLKLNDDPTKAFEFIENGKSRVLINELRVADQNAYDNLGQGDAVKMRNASQYIAKLYSQLGATSDAGTKDSLQNVIRDQELKRDVLLAEIRETYPELELSQKPEVPTVGEVQKMLDGETAFVEFAFSGKDLIVFFITKDEVDYKIISPDSDKSMRTVIEELVETYRDAIAEEKAIDVLSQLSQPIMALTLQELLDKFGSVNKLIISPDGPLSKLPFQPLHYNGQHLVQNFDIKYIPSASIIPLLNDPHRIGSNRFFGFGNQDFSGPEEADPLRNYSLAYLGNAMNEVKRVSGKFTNPTVMEGHTESERIIKSDLGKYSYIHFATHGVVNEQAPSLSKLILTNKLMETDAEEDGHLTVDEISSLKLNADLVVLSACNTGIGKLISGEGLLGMQRSFLTAGASAVMVSLWEVNDQSTVDVMTHYYDHMLKMQENEYGRWERFLNLFGWYEQPVFDYRSKALRAAQLEMIKDPYFNHPKYWAPFIYIGK